MAIQCANLLEQEHRRIQKVVATMSLTADRLDAGNDADLTVLLDITAFLRGFSEECHHVKEERFLFPLLEARGVPASGCPLAVLHHEHEKGRALLTQLDDAAQVLSSSGAAKDTVVITLRSLVTLYVGHIWKEEYLLLPMANKVLLEDDDAKLCEQFASVDTSLGGVKLQQLEQLAARLEPAL